MRLPKVLKVLSLTHWDRLEISAADGRTVFLESDREWYVERADRILGFASDSSALLEIDIAQIVAIRTHEAHRQPLDPAPATSDHERLEGGPDGTSP
jgi:hypothetical protein